MQPTMCSRCQKHVAVVFITRVENGTAKNEGLCLKCAKDLGIKPIDEMMQKMGLSEAGIYGVATFYENFSLEAKGKYVIKVCDGTACHVRKSIPILEKLRSELGLSDQKKTTDDQLFTVETVSCLGACGLAPALTVNGEVHPAMTPDKVVELIGDLRKEA